MNNNVLEGLLTQATKRVNIIGISNLNKINWDLLFDAWKVKCNENSEFQINILCESDNFLFSKSFMSDNEYVQSRNDFKKLQFFRNRVSDDLLLEVINNQLIKQISIEIIHLPIPLSIVQIDENIYINQWLINLNEDYIIIEQSNKSVKEIKNYIESFLNNKMGRKYAAPQFDIKKFIEKGVQEDVELLELYDHDRIPRGIFPRNSFYDTDLSQLVVWALIFDRKGRLLIHRRASNAKDNQDMWDKSVGGHVDFSLDVDTSRAILREVIEELFTEENKNEYKFFNVTDEEMIYLGEWRPNKRKKYPFHEINSLKREWVYFRLKESQHLYSPRTTPDNKTKRLRVISDVYLFIANEKMNDSTVASLSNSSFKLIELAELKSIMDKALKGEKIKGFDEFLEIPKFSPDLVNIFTGELLNILQEFSQCLKYYLK